MWEVIRNNKIKSAFAICLTCISYWLIFGFFVFFVIQLTYKSLILSFFCAVFISCIFGLLSYKLEVNKEVGMFYIWKDYFRFSEENHIVWWNHNTIFNYDENQFYKIHKNYNYDDYGECWGSSIIDIKETNRLCQVLYNTLEEMTIASGLSVIPNLYLVNSDFVNACSCGSNPKNSSIFITKGLLKLLNRDEMQCIIAHEMSHIINKDTMFLLYTENVPLKFLSKSREYLADAYAVQYTRNPKGLANALMKIKKYKIPHQWYPTSNLLKASFIIPVGEKKSWNRTHPPTENRIKILMSMTSADYIEYEKQYQKLTHKKLIPNSELKNSKKLEIKQSKEKEISIQIVAALSSPIQNKGILKENKDIVEEDIKKHREIEDFLHELAGYTKINCDCETKLKIPSIYANSIVICPHCKKKHLIKG